VDQWHLRSHEKVRGLKFKVRHLRRVNLNFGTFSSVSFCVLIYQEGTKRPDKVNARVGYINAEMTPQEAAHFAALLAEPAPEFTAAERAAHMAELTGVAVSSDAFFPFRDNIDVAAKHGVSYVAQPGGSVADDIVIKACNEYGIAMAFTGLRLFHH
jgi:phosphoribosylaminoimidazolecarboxamide formyltransferase/IMP cyclohydrolase